MKGRNPIVIGLVALVVIGGLFAMFMGESEEITTVGTNDVQKRVSLVAENVDGDRLPQEFKKLVVDLRDMQGNLEGLNQKIETLEQENTALKNTVESTKTKIVTSASGLEQPNEKMFPLPTLNSIMNSSTGTSPLIDEAGAFLAPGGVVAESVDKMTKSMPMKPLASVNVVTNTPSSGMIWLEPMDAGFMKDKKSVRSTGSSSSSAPSMLADIDASSPGLLNEITSKTMTKAGLESSVEPMFTLPNGSVITNSMSVTAMVGRIPINGQITDPWRFKISTGANIVMPNDHELQGLEKTIIQGDAVGDLNLRCVTGRIDTMTFIFNDGRIVTKKSKMRAGGNQSARPDQYLGYISDQYANPCIPGSLITNAPQAITQMGLLGVAAGMADGIAEAETQTTVTAQGNVVKNVVGDQLKYAGYKGVSAGVNDVRGWFATRMGQYFDVIYVKAGQVVDVHITQEIQLDYDPMGRKVRYEKSDDDRFGYMD